MIDWSKAIEALKKMSDAMTDFCKKLEVNVKEVFQPIVIFFEEWGGAIDIYSRSVRVDKWLPSQELHALE